MSAIAPPPNLAKHWASGDCSAGDEHCPKAPDIRPSWLLAADVTLRWSGSRGFARGQHGSFLGVGKAAKRSSLNCLAYWFRTEHFPVRAKIAGHFDRATSGLLLNLMRASRVKSGTLETDTPGRCNKWRAHPNAFFTRSRRGFETRPSSWQAARKRSGPSHIAQLAEKQPSGRLFCASGDLGSAFY
jgi:hypothetical protein